MEPNDGIASLLGEQLSNDSGALLTYIQTLRQTVVMTDIVSGRDLDGARERFQLMREMSRNWMLIYQEAESALAQVERLSQRLKNSILPVCRLPKNIIARIAHSASEGGSYEGTLLKCTWICHHWRVSALETAYLWTHITTFGSHRPASMLDKLTELLKRSQDLPFEVWVSFSDDVERHTKRARKMGSVLLPHLHRCHTLRLQNLPPALRRQLFPLPKAMPLLRDLIITISDIPRNSTFRFFDVGSEFALETLRIRMTRNYLFPTHQPDRDIEGDLGIFTLERSRLRYLRFDAEKDMFPKMIEFAAQCPKLEALKGLGMVYKGPSPVISRFEMLSLLTLEQKGNIDLLCSITAKRLRHLAYLSEAAVGLRDLNEICSTSTGKEIPFPELRSLKISQLENKITIVPIDHIVRTHPDLIALELDANGYRPNGEQELFKELANQLQPWNEPSWISRHQKRCLRFIVQEYDISKYIEVFTAVLEGVPSLELWLITRAAVVRKGKQLVERFPGRVVLVGNYTPRLSVQEMADAMFAQYEISL